MKELSIILPIILLVLGFFLRLLVGNKAETMDVAQSFCEVPVDLFFLCLSFLMIYTISADENRDSGFLYSMCGMVLALLIAYARRRSLDSIASKNKTWLWWFIPNLLVSLGCLIFSIILLNTNPTKDDTKSLNDGNNIELNSDALGNAKNIENE